TSTSERRARFELTLADCRSLLDDQRLRTCCFRCRPRREPRTRERTSKMTDSLDTFATRSALTVNGNTYHYFSLPKFAESTGIDIARLPFALKILLENLLRREDGKAVREGEIRSLAQWDPAAAPNHEIAFHPARVVLQDFTGVPAVVDLAAMRDAMADMGGDATKINPLFPSELV